MGTALGFKGAILGIGEESGTYGTEVPRTKFIEMNSDGLAVTEERIHSGAIPSLFVDDDEMCKGAISVGGDIQVEMRFEGMELLLKHGMGAVASVETASFVIGATNNKLDFNIGALQLTATIPSLTYKMGSTQADAGSLCKAIYDAIVLAEAVGVYTVTFSNTTKKITITRSAGTLQLLWNTGTNTAVSIASTIGFSTASDSTGGLTYTGGTAVVTVFAHTFTLADDLPLGLSLEIDRDITAFLYTGCKVNTLGMSIDTGGFLMLTAGIIGQNEATDSVTSQTLPTAPLVCFIAGAVSYGGSSRNVKSANFTLNNGLSTDRRFIGSRTMSEPQRTAKIEVTGSITMEFENTTDYDDFRNATSRALVLTFTGLTAIKGALNYSITVTFPIIKLTGKTPSIGNSGVVTVDLPFKAYASDSSAREFSIVVQNTLASV